jgi:hypothetical protein
MSNVYSENDNRNSSFSGVKLIDEYALADVNLVTPEVTISLKALILEISYYEDIFNCSTSGHILVKDSISLIERAGLCGNEFIKLTFAKTEKNVNTKESFSRYFRVYRVSERIQNNHFTETYTLHFCSEELFLSEQVKISKSYKNQQLSFIINDILKNYLKIPTKRIKIDDSDGLYDILIPFKKPFEAINWLTNLAQPLGKEGADFLFFENQEGFNFLSLQKMFEKQLYAEYAYNTHNAGTFNQVSEVGRSIFGIKSYKFLDTFDSLYGVVNGTFANRALVIDPLKREFKNVKFDYKDYFEKSSKLNSSPAIGYIKNRLGKYPYENYDSVYKVVQSNTRQKEAQHLRLAPGEVAHDIMAEVYVPYRTAQIALSTYSRIRLSLTGDPNLSVGKVIKVTLPSNVSKVGEMGSNEGVANPYSTGNYLIIGVRHIIDAQMRYETVVEVAKDSYSKKFVSNEINPEFAKAKKGDL